MEGEIIALASRRWMQLFLVTSNHHLYSCMYGGSSTFSEKKNENYKRRCIDFSCIRGCQRSWEVLLILIMLYALCINPMYLSISLSFYIYMNEDHVFFSNKRNKNKNKNCIRHYGRICGWQGEGSHIHSSIWGWHPPLLQAISQPCNHHGLA